MLRFLLFSHFFILNISLAQPEFVWGKKLGGPNSDGGIAVTVDSWGNSYTLGSFKGRVDFDPGFDTCYLNSEEYGIFISKFNSSGDLLWAKKVGNSANERPVDLCADKMGNVYITGYFSWAGDFDPGPAISYLYSFGDYDIFICKLNSSGDFLWAKRFGGGGRDAPTDIAVDSENNVYTAGFFHYLADLDPGVGYFYLSGSNVDFYGDAYMNKLDENGNFVWAKKFNGAGYPYQFSIATDLNNNLIVSGTFYHVADIDPGKGVCMFTAAATPMYQPDIFISKFNSSGNFLWALQIAGKGRKEPRALTVDKSGNIYLTGTFSDTTDFDPGPNTSNLVTDLEGDMFVSKYDARGKLIWAKQILSPDGWTVSTSIAVDEKENVFTTGYFGIADFDPGPATYTLSSPVFSGIFISELNINGNFVCATGMNNGGIGPCSASSIASDNNGNFYITGFLNRSLDFAPGTGEYYLTASGSFDAFICKYQSCELEVGITPLLEPPDNILVYPNPSNGKFTLSDAHPGKIKIYNVMGELIPFEISTEQEIDIGLQAPGIYFLELSSANKKEIRKLIIE